jgi:endonuclease/exonuclease/phosphatase family metal-dependent hydrolase
MTCDDTVLTKALEKDSAFAAENHSVLHQPSATDVYELGGGNSVFSRHLLTDAYEAKFVNGQSIPLSGYVMTRVQVAPDVEFDLWTVHLEAGSDGCDDDCRWEQATDFGSAVEMISGTPEKGKTGVPVLIVGDLNTGGPMSTSEKPPYAGNGGYENVIADALSKPRDLWLELGSGDGWTYDCTGNTIPKCKYRERIDYVLLPEDEDIVHSSAVHYFLPLKIEVVRWKTPAGGHVSDHFGLDVTLELRRRPKPVEKPAPAKKSSGRKPVKLDAPGRWD